MDDLKFTTTNGKTWYLGTVSEATLKADDVAPKYHAVLKHLAPDRLVALAKDFPDLLDESGDLRDPNEEDMDAVAVPHPETYEELVALEQQAEDYEDHAEPDWEARDEALSEFVNAMEDELNDLAPDGVYFGSHIGDGADFGFWRDEQDFDDE